MGSEELPEITREELENALAEATWIAIRMIMNKYLQDTVILDSYYNTKKCKLDNFRPISLLPQLYH